MQDNNRGSIESYLFSSFVRRILGNWERRLVEAGSILRSSQRALHVGFLTPLMNPTKRLESLRSVHHICSPNFLSFSPASLPAHGPHVLRDTH